MRRYVVHEHWASTHHFDFRLEMDGVLKSWAIPKGIPEEFGVKKLAVGVDNHDLEYIDFSGEIPEGQYGAGKVLIWDKGQYSLIKRSDHLIKFKLEGERLDGIYQLIRFKSERGKEQWLLMKVDR